RGFLSLVIISGLLSLTAFVSGLMLSFIVNIPAGAGVILSNVMILILVKILERVKS
ncbi:MAG: metal ABC transporter permease, partial [Synergistaceae bacterium]|nr:metal ABC transporter permease [Synergistaceae bacterium]